ncbi:MULTISPECIES: hypothetical protein [unclassified Streptococcus]|uniref:hypothetical protein n=1 Tax=unclassified Streptococcus TaxID=2608887 RepID=UPI00359D8D3C
MKKQPIAALLLNVVTFVSFVLPRTDLSATTLSDWGGQSSGSGSASRDVTFSDSILQTKEVFSVLRLKLALLVKEC